MHQVALKEASERELLLYEIVLTAIERAADYLFTYRHFPRGEEEFAELVETNVKQCLFETIERRVHEMYGDRRINGYMFESDDFLVALAIKNEMERLGVELDAAYSYLRSVSVRQKVIVPGLFEGRYAFTRGGGFQCATRSN